MRNFLTACAITLDILIGAWMWTDYENFFVGAPWFLLAVLVFSSWR